MERTALEALLSDLESDRVERTASTSNTDKFCKAICAFANDLPNHRQPGYLFIGAGEDGAPSFLADIDERLLEQLSGIRSDGNIQPLPAMNVQKWNLHGGDMVVIEVFPSDLPPVRYKGQVWIRVGPRSGIASEAEERILTERRTSLARTWDARPCRESRLEDLVLDLFTVTYRPNAVARSVISDNHRTMEDQLAALRFFEPRSACPTNAGVVLFAKDPRFFMPGAYVQFVAYEGETQATTPLRERVISGDLLTVMRDLDGLAAEIAGPRPEQMPTGAEREVCQFPPRAMHELLMNAVIHRNYEATTPIQVNLYSDRLELLSPGGLYGDLTVEQFPHVTAYRNPVLAEAAKILGFVNKYGRGVDVAQAELRRNGSPAAMFEMQPNHFLVTVRRRQ